MHGSLSRVIALAVTVCALAWIGQHGHAAEGKQPDKIVKAGFNHLENGKPTKALEKFNSALERKPSDVSALFGRAKAYSAAGRHDDAFAAYSKVVQRAPGHILAWNGRGIAAFNMLAFDKALDSFLRATKNRPVNGFFYESLAWTRLCRGEHEKALQAAQTATEMYQRSEQTNLYPLLIAYFAERALDRTQAASETLTYALDMAQSKEWPYPVFPYLRGVINADELISHVTDSTEETEAHTYIGLNARASGKTEKARRHLEWVAHRGNGRVFEYTLAKTLVKPDQVALER